MDRTKSINRKGKPQPGERSGLPPLSKHNFNSKTLIEYTLTDYPGTKYIGNMYELPDCDSYIVALVIAKMPDGRFDYHWYRQDSNGWWSHKPGSSPVTNRDASGKLIVDPKLADRDYNQSPNDGGFDYDEFVGYFKVPVGMMWEEIRANNETTRHSFIERHVDTTYVASSFVN